jgi:cell wall-associated NlpC family hydrolase
VGSLRACILGVCLVFTLADDLAADNFSVPDPMSRELGSQVALHAVASHALNYLDAPYRLGGTDPRTGFDCSGLVVHVFRNTLGLTLPRTARQLASVGEAIERTALQPGDLVFFNTRGAPFSHVGIYLGDAKFIHAPRPRARVRIDSLDDPAFSRTFQGARRIS